MKTLLAFSRKFITGLSVAAFMATAAPALAATPKDTLVIAFAFDDIITLDPAESFELSTGEIVGNTYNKLVMFDIDEPSNIYGDLAESWEISEDGLTYTFKIRPDVKFASGNPLTAHDVAYSIQRAVKLDKNPVFILSQFGLTADNVEENAKAVDDTTFVLKINQAFAPSFVLNCLTADVASVVDRQLLQQHEQDGDMGYNWLKTNYAGSGPMIIRDWRPSEIIVLERNNNYFGEPSKLQRVIYRYASESSSQRLMLERGDIDIARNLSPTDIDAVAQDADIHLASRPKGTVYYISLNQKNEYLSKPEVREAMKYLVDYEAIGATLIKNIGELHQTFLPKGVLGASNETPYHLDVEKAKQLLAQAGLEDGFSVTIDVRSVQPVMGISEAFQQTLAQAGIKLEIIPGDGNQVLTKYRARRHDMYIGQWGMDYQDPHTNADTFASNPDNADGASATTLAWRNAWDIPELTAETRAAVLEGDAEKRVNLYHDLQQKVLDDGPFIILYQQVEVAAVRANVENYRLGPSFSSNYLFNVSKN